MQLEFAYTSKADASRNLHILFAEGAHGDAYPFDGRGKALAHTFYPAGSESGSRSPGISTSMRMRTGVTAWTPIFTRWFCMNSGMLWDWVMRTNRMP